MKEAFLITGVFDMLSGGDTGKESNENKEYNMEDYQEMLKEYKNAEAEILINIATIHFENENIPESIKTLKKAIKIYAELEDMAKQGLVYDLMGDVNRYNKNNSSALEDYKKAYKFYFKIKSEYKNEIREKIKSLEVQESNVEPQHINNYGVPSNVQSEAPKQEVKTPDIPASEYTKISKKIEEVIGMLNGADTYLIYARSEEPMEQLENAYEMSEGIGDETAKSTLLLIIGFVSLEKTKTNDAIKYFNASLENFQEMEDKKGEAVSRLLIGTADYINGDMDKVSSNFRKSIEILRDMKDIPGENIAMELMNSIYEEE
jgi:tetratricopeptide (TPR) repeat protein